MKNIVYKILLFAVICLLIVIEGCKKTEVETSNVSFMDRTVYLKDCNIISLGITNHTPATYKYEVTFCTSGVLFNEADSTYSGKGSYITLDLFSSSESDLIPGTYTFDAFSSKDDFTINKGTFDFYQKEIDISMDFKFKYGVLEVSRWGNSFTFKLDFYTDENITGGDSWPVTGYYTGVVNNI